MHRRFFPQGWERALRALRALQGGDSAAMLQQILFGAGPRKIVRNGVGGMQLFGPWQGFQRLRYGQGAQPRHIQKYENNMNKI